MDWKTVQFKKIDEKVIKIEKMYGKIDPLEKCQEKWFYFFKVNPLNL